MLYLGFNLITLLKSYINNTNTDGFSVTLDTKSLYIIESFNLELFLRQLKLVKNYKPYFQASHFKDFLE